MPGASQQVSLTINEAASNHPFSYWVPQNDAPVPGGRGRLATATGEIHRPRRHLVGRHAAERDDAVHGRRAGTTRPWPGHVHDAAARTDLGVRQRRLVAARLPGSR